MRVPLKCTEFFPYNVDFADGFDREGPFFRLYNKFLILKIGPHKLGTCFRHTPENFSGQKP